MINGQRLVIPPAAKRYSTMTIANKTSDREGLANLLADGMDGADRVLFQYFGCWWVGFEGTGTDPNPRRIVTWFLAQLKNVMIGPPVGGIYEVNVQALTGAELGRAAGCAQEALALLDEALEDNRRTIVENRLMIAKCETWLKDLEKVRGVAVKSAMQEVQAGTAREAGVLAKLWMDGQNVA